MVEGRRAPGDGYVEARQVAARLAPETSRHPRNVPAAARVVEIRTSVRLLFLPVQRSFDELGAPLHEVTFCVIDLETTGGSPAMDAITEVGALKMRGGECLATFQTLVNPGVGIPPEIVVLTGITQAMVIPAPPIDEVLPALSEFIGGAVIVGHNVRFDIGFLDAALARTGRPRLGNQRVDTCALARRLVRDEVPDCKLSTLASRLRLPHQPCHRALADVLATADLLHLLLERAGTLGVLGLDDLLELPTIRAHPSAGKLRLTAGLPRRPGVYLFHGRGGRVLYVGKATNLRARVRSYFSGDERRKVGQLLRETEGIDHIRCAGPLEAAVLEVRLIHEHQPPFNKRAKLWRRYVYLKLTLDERFPRLSVVRTVRANDGCLYLGPLSSSGAARQVADAIESAVPIRRCSARPGKGTKPGPCAAAQLGVATCPCAGTVTETDYRQLVDVVVKGLTTEPSVLLEPLTARMRALAEAGRFEDAATVRDRAAALSRALQRQRQLEAVSRSAWVEMEVAPAPGSGAPTHTVVLSHGRLVGPGSFLRAEPSGLQRDVHAGTVVRRDDIDELTCVASWLQSSAARIRLVRCEGELASALPRLPQFEPTTRRR